jgi:hypothetical protein
MSLDISMLQTAMCRSLCSEVELHQRSDGRIAIYTPFRFADGDSLLMMAVPLPAGGIRLTDCGNTMMHLSYHMDIDSILKPGNRSDLLHEIIRDHDLRFDDGEIYVDTPADDVGKALFRLGQALSQVHDISFLSRSRVASTFYEDLDAILHRIAPAAIITPKYIIEGFDDADRYTIDYRLEFQGSHCPLFLFGIHSNDKARLATIIIQHWLSLGIIFTSFLVYQDLSKISRPDEERLLNVGDEFISSLGAVNEMKRKLEKRYGKQSLSIESATL